ncbi:hypothetical protein FH972_021442 [Carpinus fangiana]|uniref:DEAD-box ATP-dependent RNA helicase 21 n=1 Tax=Carpinus fangiana TaxID=176857 RepID=A0A5N6KPC5_9ROSI|nr:hypothetical protein FH972_021442 [Carpinus fangiana]
MDAPPPPPPPPPSSASVPPPPTADTRNGHRVPPPPPADLVPPPPPTNRSFAVTPTPNTSVPKRPTPAPKKQPLSVEEILRKKKEADEAAAKPKFLSRKEREKIALEKRQKEVEDLKKRQQTERISELGSLQAGAPNGTTHRNGAQSHEYGDDARSSIPTGPKSQRGRDAPPEPASLRNGQHANGHPAPSKSTAGSTKKRPVSEEEAAAALMRERYMGAEQNTSKFSAQKKRKRTTEKKFTFEWNAEEDTSQDYNPIYQQRTETSFFGRGRLGGFAEDPTDNVAKTYAKAIAARDAEGGSTRANEILDMKRRLREEGDKHGIDKHWSEKKLDQMRERDWRIFKEDFNIATKGGNIPNPMRTWDESKLHKSLLKIVDQVGYDEPSAVQRAAIPIALQSRDLIAVAVTGSGKTAAFLLPLLQYISELPTLDDYTKNDGPYSIILAPTRELAQQIEIEAKKFATPLGFTCVSIVGGHSIEEQSYNMRDGAEIIIATPGRLVDCIERRVLVLSQCCYVIMDEADRMIDMGFEEPVNKILDALPVANEKPDTDAAENAAVMSQHIGGKDRYRQTMMYTATMPSAVERIARRYMRRPAIVTIGNVGEAVDTVEQRVEFVSGEDRRKTRLRELLGQRDVFPPPIIVFVNIKRNCDAIARDIGRWGHAVVTLHGSKTQEQREAALAALRRGDAEVLVATDLAGRGIDVPDVSLVVNFNMATNIESYTHRIGRTGRQGKSGVAVTFVHNEDSDVLYDLKQMVQKSSISRVPEELKRHEAAQQKRGRGEHGRGGGDRKGGGGDENAGGGR